MYHNLTIGDFYHGVINRLERDITFEKAKMEKMSMQNGYTFEEWMLQAIYVTELLTVMDAMLNTVEEQVNREFNN